MHITILGAGAIGTAIQQNLKTSHKISLWDKQAGKVLDQKNLSDIIPHSDIVFFCFPTLGIPEGIEAIKPLLKHDALAITLAKGLMPNGQLATAMLEQTLGPKRTVLLTGPMLAQEFHDGKGAAALVASKNPEAITKLGQAFKDNSIYLSFTADVRSAALASVWKNIYTLIVGIAEGAGFGNNIQGILAAQCITEASVAASMLSVDAKIINGIAGTADFIATALSPLSRNRQAGIDIGKGLVSKTTEGVRSLEPFINLLPGDHDLPILQTLRSITQNHSKPRTSLEELLTDIVGQSR